MVRPKSATSGLTTNGLEVRARTQMEDRIKVTGIAYNANVAKITVQSVPGPPGTGGRAV